MAEHSLTPHEQDVLAHLLECAEAGLLSLPAESQARALVEEITARVSQFTTEAHEGYDEWRMGVWERHWREGDTLVFHLPDEDGHPLCLDEDRVKPVWMCEDCGMAARGLARLSADLHRHGITEEPEAEAA